VNIAALVPDLRYHFTNSNYADTEMARALARAGSQGISCLTNFLATGDPRVRKRAGWALNLDGRVRNQPGVLDALIHSADSDPDGRFRASIVLGLSRFRKGGETNRLVPLGLRFLRSEDGYNRWAGASLLQNYRSVPEVKTALHAAASDPDERVRSVIARALKESATGIDRN
jgi:HEAT repeat protein